MTEPLSRTIFTVESDQQPILAFTARRHEEADAFFKGDKLRSRLRLSKSGGKALLNDLTILRLRLANSEERARFRSAGDTSAAIFLVEMDDE